MPSFKTPILNGEARAYMVELAGKGTKGPWSATKLAPRTYGVYTNGQPGVQFEYKIPSGWGPLDENDAENIEFITVAKDAVPKLCAHIDALEALHSTVKAFMDQDMNEGGQFGFRAIYFVAIGKALGSLAALENGGDPNAQTTPPQAAQTP